MSDYNLSFISQDDFEQHIAETLGKYNDSLKGIDLASFNSNVIDPIKLLFDKEAFKQTFEETISFELQRQRDKHNTNAIGYFHQNFFKHIANCEVPNAGWDVIFHGDKDIFVEMKNKHNTMNSTAAQKTYMRMQNKILEDENCECYLVEAIAPRSRDVAWTCSVDGQSLRNERIRRVSMDKFYALTTGINDAFYQMCIQLPKTIKKLIDENAVSTIQPDTVIEELKRKNPDMLKALYLLAFNTYEGFDNLV
ncbi:Eco47II family restriction endonuclease [Candidatus Saccharibacteria bacterium]|nr:Eco47II family restriction endonuclease [Candidatus Saccharibacteria bacterium]